MIILELKYNVAMGCCNREVAIGIQEPTYPSHNKSLNGSQACWGFFIWNLTSQEE